MAYTAPRVRIFQEFRNLPAATEQPLIAFILGPHGVLHRYSEASEKEVINLGSYDANAAVAYDWPGKEDDSTIDLDYVKLYAENADLRYYEDATGVGSDVVPVSGSRNRVRLSSRVLVTANGFDRSSVFYDRDVKIGDAVFLSGVGDDLEVYEVNTTIRGLAADVVASSVEAAFDDDANAATQSLTASVDKIGGADNGITLTVSASSYDGLLDGDISESYTIEVTQSSTGGDLTTARLRVTSASGRDNDLVVVPNGAGGFTPIGSRGLAVEFDQLLTVSASSDALDDGVTVDDLIAGQKWRVTVNQAFTAPVATSGGTYTGEKDTTYIIEVTKGGVWADLPEISVYTTTAYDLNGPREVSGASTNVDVGNYGVTVSFSGSGLRKGDKYYIPAVAESEGAIRTIVLARDLPTPLLGATDLNIELSIRKNLQVSYGKEGFSPATNWDATQANFTVNSGMIAYDSTWTEEGTPLPLDIARATLFVEYREWSTRWTTELGEFTDPGDLSDLIGSTDPDNPLGFALLCAGNNANGTLVRFKSVADPESVESWSAAIEDISDSRDGIYNLVPLSEDPAIQSLIVAHVSSQSTPDLGNYRGAFLAASNADSIQILGEGTSDDGEVVLATLADDSSEPGTQYTLLTLTSDNANLDDLGIQANDEVRFLYSTTGFGDLSYSTFKVKEVLSNQTLLLSTGHTSAVAVAQRVEIWRTLTQRQKADSVATRSGSLANRRICHVWADRPRASGRVVANYFLAAAIAGLRSGVQPHQPLTNFPLLGFESISRSFSSSNLDRMADAGTWLVVQLDSGEIVTRDALTTDRTDLSTWTESLRTNVDSISFTLLNQLRSFIGRTNINDNSLRVLRVTLQSTFENLRSRSLATSAGPQVLDYEILRLEQNETQKDQVDVFVRLTLPIPMNRIDVYLEI